MRIGWQVYTKYDPMRVAYEVYLFHEDHHGRSVVKDMTFEKLDRHGLITGGPRPSVPYENAEDFLQSVLDAAWEVGLRPKGHADHTNELTAVRYHLEDMRKLAKVDK